MSACSSSCRALSPGCQTPQCCSWRESKDLQACWPVNIKSRHCLREYRFHLFGVAKYSVCPPLPPFLGVCELGPRSFMPRSKDLDGERTCWGDSRYFKDCISKGRLVWCICCQDWSNAFEGIIKDTWTCSPTFLPDFLELMFGPGVKKLFSWRKRDSNVKRSQLLLCSLCLNLFV